jgi:hypothetical protein
VKEENCSMKTPFNEKKEAIEEFFRINVEEMNGMQLKEMLVKN